MDQIIMQLFCISRIYQGFPEGGRPAHNSRLWALKRRSVVVRPGRDYALASAHAPVNPSSPASTSKAYITHAVRFMGQEPNSPSQNAS